MNATNGGERTLTRLDFVRFANRDLAPELSGGVGVATHRGSTSSPAPASSQADDEIRRTLLTRLERESWWDKKTSDIFVGKGNVIYQGVITDVGTRQVARRIAEAVPGVCGVWDSRVPRREWQGMA